MDLKKSFDEFLKLVPKLPILLQVVLLPVLVLLLLLSLSVVMVSFTVLFCRRYELKGFMEQFVEQKNQEMNQAISKIETIYEAIKLQIQIDKHHHNGENSNNLQQAKGEVEDAIKTLQISKQNLYKANAEFDEAIKDFLCDAEQFKQRPKLSVWLVKKLPEEWRSDLEELQRDWINSGCSWLMFQLRTFQRLLEMSWAFLMIRWQDFRDGNATKLFGDKRTTN